MLAGPETEAPTRPGLRRTAVLVINTHSRKGEKAFFRALDGLAERGIDVTASYPVRNPSRLVEVAREAIGRGADLVIVGGGDGTISSIVDDFAYRDVVLGLLPLGTGNSFARTLGLPITLDGALDVIAHGKVARVDLGKVGDDYFANTASIGLIADIARRTSRRMKRVLGYAAYGLTGFWTLLTHQHFTGRLTLDNGEEFTFRTHQIVIASGSVFGLSKIAPDARVDDKLLNIFTMDTLNRLQIVKLWVAFLLGKSTAFPEARFFTTHAVSIETDPPQFMDVDGETTTHTPVRIEVASGALQVMVPQAFTPKQFG